MAARTSTPAYQWPNWLDLLSAVWLFISPWVFGFAYGAGDAEAVALPNAGAAAWNAWVTAVIVGILSLAAVAKLAIWDDWVDLVLGVWLFFSPWILGYAALGGAMWNSLVVGFLIGLLAIWGIAAARSVSVRT